MKTTYAEALMDTTDWHEIESIRRLVHSTRQAWLITYVIALLPLQTMIGSASLAFKAAGS